MSRFKPTDAHQNNDAVKSFSLILKPFFLANVTVQLTSKRILPFSLGQLDSCASGTRRFDLIVSKGVIAPALYEAVCDQFIRATKAGSASAGVDERPY